MLTGQVGRPGTGLHPLRGQNNVQGASDVGLIPMMYPDYRRVDNADARQRFEALWGVPLDPKAGLTVVEIMSAASAGTIRGMYVMGENPAMSDPDVHHAREALSKLEMLVVQDIFLTETCYLADVILPATAFPEKTGTFTNTDRTVQLGRQALSPPGRRAAGSRHRRRDGEAARSRLELRASARRVRRDAQGDAVDRRHHLGAARARARGHLSVRARRRSGRAGGVHARFPDVERTCTPRPGTGDLCGRAARRRVSVRADHRAAARALAHRQHDPPHRGARRDRAGTRGVDCIRRTSPRWVWPPAEPSRSRRGAAASRSTRAPTTARRAAPCSFRSASTRPRRTCSPIPCSIRSARFRSSSTARWASAAGGDLVQRLAMHPPATA